MMDVDLVMDAKAVIYDFDIVLIILLRRPLVRWSFYDLLYFLPV